MAKKDKVANRLYIDTNGNVVKGEDVGNAVGVRYEALGDNGTIAHVTEIKDLTKINEAGLLLLALFGAKTWIGNLYNQDLTPDDVQERIDSVTRDGEWPERQGFGGPRYDQDALAMAIAAAKGETDPAPYLKRLVEEKGYAGMAMRHAQVAENYNKTTGKATKLTDL